VEPLPSSEGEAERKRNPLSQPTAASSPFECFALKGGAKREKAKGEGKGIRIRSFGCASG